MNEIKESNAIGPEPENQTKQIFFFLVTGR